MNCEESTPKILWDNLYLNCERLKRTPSSMNIKHKIKTIRIKIANFYC